MTSPRAHRPASARFPLALLAAWFLVALALAFDVHDRSDWLLENLLAVAFVGVLAATWRRFPFSRVSYALMFAFLILHEVGAHWTYANVPYDAWCESLFGRSLADVFGFRRNHYDRLVHFLYGFLLAYPMREVFVRIASAIGFWGYFLPLLMTMATSCLYEILEWLATLVVAPELGAAYLGLQGDEFDAVKDMALASLGACLALVVIGLVHRSRARDFQAEWAESLRVKQVRPLGEDRGHERS